jgi:hypothetical protein
MRRLVVHSPYRDLTTETTLGTTQLKTLNRLRNTMIDHDFRIQDRQKADLPDFLKKRQRCGGQEETEPNRAFNKVIHVDLINADTDSNGTPSKTILSITDDTRTFTQVAVMADSEIDSTVSAIWHLWCQPYGPPETIMLNQGKVRAGKLESRINDCIPMVSKISCRSRKNTFNQEIQQQWQQNKYEVSADEFAQNWNFLCNLQSPDTARTGYPNHKHLDGAHQNISEDEYFTEEETDADYRKLEEQPRISHKRKPIGLCRHKLQRRTLNSAIGK